MQEQTPDTPAWLNLLSKIWPMLVLFAGLLWTAIEVRVRKLIHESEASTAAEQESKRKEMREALQDPIGDIGLDAMKALEKTTEHSERIHDLEIKIAPVWKMIERRIDDSLRQGETPKDKK